MGLDHLLIAPRSSFDRALDVGLGLTAIGWAVAGLVAGDGPWIPRAGISALNVTVGVLFVARSAAMEPGAFRDAAYAAPSVVASAVGSTWSADVWPAWAEIVFVLASAWTLASLGALGRSFAVLPTRRELVSRGPYRLVRHPVYAGELTMMVTTCATSGVWPALACLAVLLALLVPRIAAEERVLAGDPAYAAYARRVRYRLLPGLV